MVFKRIEFKEMRRKNVNDSVQTGSLKEQLHFINTIHGVYSKNIKDRLSVYQQPTKADSNTVGKQLNEIGSRSYN